MTNAGFERLAGLFVADILKVTYEKDAVPGEKPVSSYDLTDGNLDIFIDIPDSENGSFDNFKVIAQDLTIYTERVLSFTKTADGLKVKIPFVFVNVSA